MDSITWALCPPLGLANGRHQQKVGGWKEREAGVCLPCSLLALILRFWQWHCLSVAKALPCWWPLHHHDLQLFLPRSGLGMLQLPTVVVLGALCTSLAP